MKTNPCEQVFEPLLNSREAGKLLGVHPATMKRLATAGKLPCVKVGKLWRFSCKCQRKHTVDRLNPEPALTRSVRPRDPDRRDFTAIVS